MSNETVDFDIKLKKGAIHSNLNIELLNREWKDEAKRLEIPSDGNFSKIILLIEGKSVQNGIWKFLIRLVKIVNLFTIGYFVLPFIAFYNLFSNDITWINRIIGFPLCWVTAFTLFETKTTYGTSGLDCSIFLPFEQKYVFYFYIFSIVSFFGGKILFNATYRKWITALDAYCPNCLRPSAKEKIEKIYDYEKKHYSYQREIDTPRIEHFDSMGRLTGYSREVRYETVSGTIPIKHKKTFSKCRFCDHVWDATSKELG